MMLVFVALVPEASAGSRRYHRHYHCDRPTVYYRSYDPYYYGYSRRYYRPVYYYDDYPRYYRHSRRYYHRPRVSVVFGF